MRRGPLLVPLLSLVLASCGGGEKTIEPDGAAESVSDVVSRETGFVPKDVDCPSGVAAEVGTTFDCHFTGPEGPYVAQVTIKTVEGENATFLVKARPEKP